MDSAPWEGTICIKQTPVSVRNTQHAGQTFSLQLNKSLNNLQNQDVTFIFYQQPWLAISAFPELFAKLCFPWVKGSFYNDILA